MALELVVVGLGPRGRDWVEHVRAHPGFALAGCADVHPEALERGEAELEIPAEHRFATTAEALDAVPCDAVLVATTADCHVEPVRTALERGVAVLVEKPFTTRLEEAVALVEQAESRGVPLVVGQNYRHLRGQRATRRVVRDGVLGTLGIATVHHYHGADHLPATRHELTDAILWGPVVHHLDAIPYVLDKPIVGILAEIFRAPWGPLTSSASMTAMLRLEGDVHVSYSATYQSSGHEFFQGGQEFYERFMGERATLHVMHRWLVLCERGKRPRVIRRGPRRQTEEATLLDQLERVCRDGVEPETSGRRNLRTVAALDACRISARERRWVDPRELLAEHSAARGDRAA